MNKKLSKRFILTLVLVMCTVMCFANCVSASTYTDTEHWAKNYIDYVTEQKYFYGTSDTTFSPDMSVTRGMFVTVLARYADANLSDYKLSPFEDIAEEKYYTKAVLWAYENDIVAGIDKTHFSPDSFLTREQAATILYRYLELECSKKIPDYNDWDKVSNWAKDAVATLSNNKLFVGSNGSFNPKNNITRAEVAVLFSRLDGKELGVYNIPVKEPKMTYIGTYRLTYYCSGCAGTITASGKKATVDHTVALPRNMWGQWKQYKGKTIYIENIGYRVIEDKCGTNAFDLYCSGGCGSQPFNTTKQKIYLVED